jgi:hypothetical protein
MYSEEKATARALQIFQEVGDRLEAAGVAVTRMEDPFRLMVRPSQNDSCGVQIRITHHRPRPTATYSVSVRIDTFGVYLGTDYPSKTYSDLREFSSKANAYVSKLVDTQKVVDRVLRGLVLAKARSDEDRSQMQRSKEAAARSRDVNMRAKTGYLSKIYVMTNGRLAGFDHLQVTDDQAVAILEFTKNLLGLPDVPVEPEVAR